MKKSKTITRPGILLDQWVSYYDDEHLHSALNYLRPVDYYRANLEALIAERRSKLTKSVARRKEVNRRIQLLRKIRIVATDY